MTKEQSQKLAQADKFIETAKALGCEDDDAAFKAKLRRIAPAKAETPKPKKKPTKKKA